MSQHNTRKDKERFLKLLERNMMNVDKTCKKFKISRRQFYRWKEDEWFADAVEDIREGLIDMSEAEVYKQIKNGDARVREILSFLELQAKHRGYIKESKSTNDHNHKGQGINIEITRYNKGK